MASTIDGAQGATADIGILLARPSLDREHLYVAMTRGRHANHAHVTGTSTDPDHDHRPVTTTVATLDDAVRTLQAATAQVGAEQSAHTLLDQSRSRRPQLTAQQRGTAYLPPLSSAALRRQAELTRMASPPPPDPMPAQRQQGPSMSR